MIHPYRVLITGSREWTDEAAIHGALADLPTDRTLVIVHGDCFKGADAIAKAWAFNRAFLGDDVIEEAHPANWRPGGNLDRSAGFRRNAEMVQLGADLCLAFIRNGSRGATHTADLAEKAGIPTRRFTA
ncbi:SLOG family protein [Streptomyces sp. NPDC126499]|uniref:SLOG family protein n=1 Tax=Streptomyces sp. NPDC126499 TaxID=3155314 RepID=UPI0033223496